jgi:hypothetical protein
LKSCHFPLFFQDAIKLLPEKSLREARYRSGLYIEDFKNLLQTCQPNEIENKCMEMFDDLPDKGKLAVACSLYANNLVCNHSYNFANVHYINFYFLILQSCSRFNKKTVRHLAPHIPDLTSEELVSLLLVIYMQKDWDPDGREF